MNFTLENIQNRIVLAQCCLADLGTRALDYRASGQTTSAECVTRKAYLLQYIIKRLRCFKPSIGSEQWTESFTIGTAAGGSDIDFFVRLSTTPTTIYMITPPDVAIGTLSATAAATKMAAAINAYNSDNPEEIYATATSSGDVLYITIRSSERIDWDTAIVGTASSGVSATSTGDGAVSDVPVPRLSNDNAKKLLGIMDEYCGCPCGQSDAEITDDSISLALSEEP